MSYFEYLLTRFTEPNEIFSPVDLAARQRVRGIGRGLLSTSEDFARR